MLKEIEEKLNAKFVELKEDDWTGNVGSTVPQLKLKTKEMAVFYYEEPPESFFDDLQEMTDELVYKYINLPHPFFHNDFFNQIAFAIAYQSKKQGYFQLVLEIDSDTDYDYDFEYGYITRVILTQVALENDLLLFLIQEKKSRGDADKELAAGDAGIKRIREKISKAIDLPEFSQAIEIGDCTLSF